MAAHMDPSHDIIALKTNGRIYRVPRMPYEPFAQAYDRGWYIVEKTNGMDKTTPSAEKLHQIVNESFEWLHGKQGMSYT